jgi:hypothetical protein
MRRSFTHAALVGGTLLLLVPDAAMAQRRPAGTEADGRAATEIERRLVVDPGVNAQHVTIYVRDGVATLTGRVPGEQAKSRAAGLAEGVPGVTRVQNRIVTGLGRGEPPATVIPDHMPGTGE